MPDITMCKGTMGSGDFSFTCKDKNECYRYQATPDQHRQSWFMNLPRKDNDTPCTYFILMSKKDGYV